MKYFRGYLAVAMFVALFVFALPVIPVIAQTTSTVSIDQLMKHANDGMFQEVYLALNNEKTEINRNKTASDYQTKLQTNAAETDAWRAAKATFEQYLASHQNDPPKQAYTDALTAANMALANAQNNNALLRDGLGKTFMDAFMNKVGLEARNTEWITAISDGTPLSQQAQNAARAVTAAANPSSVPSGDCSISSWTVLGCINSALTWIVKNILLQIVGFALWVSANLLNFAIYHGIFMFKNFAPENIYAIWVVIRQIVSLFVFFAGMFVGFMAIIGKSDDYKKYLAFLVVYGLFVNFSYPLVRVFVDISNVVSLQIYQTTLGTQVLSDNSGSTAGALIMQKMGLQKLIFSATSAGDQGSNDFINKVSSLPGALAAVGFVGYSAYIFFMAAFLIIMRTALLVCIIIASPILLVDTVVPALGESAKWLRGVFISQLFVAPVFTIMLALTLKFLDIFSAADGGSQALGAATSSGSVQVFFNLVMMIVMLHIMLKVTKSVAGEIGKKITDFAGKAGGVGTGLAIGAGAATLGFAGRQGLGRLGERLGQQGGVIGDLGRKMSGAKYDLRNLGGVGLAANKLGISGMGKGVDKSRKEAADARAEEVIKTAQGLNDDEERDIYLRRKFSPITNNIPNNKQYRGMVQDDEAVLKQYIGATADRRQEMMNDEKNKRFTQRFGNINNGNTAGLSPALQKALADKAAKDKANEQRNLDRVANYFTADQTAREAMHANAIAANDQTLLKQLSIMEDLRSKGIVADTNNLAGLGDQALINKVLANQTAKQQATAQATQAAQAAEAAQAAVQKAQADAAQAQVDAARQTQQVIANMAQTQQQTTQTLADLAQGMNDLAAHLKSTANA